MIGRMTDAFEAAPARRALLVHAHPEERSFSSAQADAVLEQLRADGMEVRRLDLYAEGRDPVLHRDQFASGSGYFKPQAQQMTAVLEKTLGSPSRAISTSCCRRISWCSRSPCGGSRCRRS